MIEFYEVVPLVPVVPLVSYISVNVFLECWKRYILINQGWKWGMKRMYSNVNEEQWGKILHIGNKGAHKDTIFPR